MAGSNFVDYVKIFARSGHGGAGSAHFRREKFVAFGGPDGGDGGKGGSIVLQGDSQYWTLIHLKYQRHQFAEDGQCGSGSPLVGPGRPGHRHPRAAGHGRPACGRTGGRHHAHRRCRRGDGRRRTARTAQRRPGRPRKLAFQERHEPDAALCAAGRGGRRRHLHPRTEGLGRRRAGRVPQCGQEHLCSRWSRLPNPRSPTMLSPRSNPTWASSRCVITSRSSWPIFRVSSRGARGPRPGHALPAPHRAQLGAAVHDPGRQRRPQTRLCGSAGRAYAVQP